MKAKRVLAVLVFVHVLLHPVVHALPVPGPLSPNFRPPSEEDAKTVETVSLGPCLGCRTGSSLVATPVAFALDTAPTGWEKIPLLAPSHSSPQFDPALPARAPPLA